jgi:tRNA nucleotidyltransferase (CCA-adding enzyme)
MPLSLSPFALMVLARLRSAGYEAHIVGGAVRDLLRETPEIAPIDYDFTTNATPDQIQEVFPESFYENTFGTVSVTHEELCKLTGATYQDPPNTGPADNRRKLIDIAAATKLHVSLDAITQEQRQEAPAWPDYQITTYRSESKYSDFRRPDEVKWGTDLAQDLARRDFTINALALSVSDEFLKNWQTAPDLLPALVELSDDQYFVADPYGGQADLKSYTIKTVGEASERFQEDALRMLRAVRLSVQLNFEIDPVTFQAIQTLAEHLEHVSGERIRDELLKILSSPFPAEGIELLDISGLLPLILPELLEAKGIEQAGHHTTDVWTHSIDALRNCPSSDPIVRLATLLHDIAKPRTQRYTADSITFYNHEIVGARMARAICQRLRLSSDDTDRVFTLVRHHMFHYEPKHTDAAIRRFMRKVGLPHIDDILDLREGDRLGSGARKTSWRLEEMKERMIEQLHQPMDLSDLAINGHELMEVLGLKPGPQLGKMLQALFEIVLDEPEKNTKERLLEEAKKLA